METARVPEGLVRTIWLLHLHEKACYSATQWVIGCVAFATLNLGPGLLSVRINPQSVEISDCPLKFKAVNTMARFSFRAWDLLSGAPLFSFMNSQAVLDYKTGR